MLVSEWVLSVSVVRPLTLCVSNRKLSKAGVSLLKPEPRLRGAADSVLHSVRTLPCHILRYLLLKQHALDTKSLHRYTKQNYLYSFSLQSFFVTILRFWIFKFQFPHCPLVWKENAVPGFSGFTAESHEGRAPTRPGQVNRGGTHASTRSLDDTTGSKITDFCWLTVWRPKEQVSGLWRQWDWHNVCGPAEGWGTERPDPGKNKINKNSAESF